MSIYTPEFFVGCWLLFDQPSVDLSLNNGLHTTTTILLYTVMVDICPSLCRRHSQASEQHVVALDDRDDCHQELNIYLLMFGQEVAINLKFCGMDTQKLGKVML